MTPPNNLKGQETMKMDEDGYTDRKRGNSAVLQITIPLNSGTLQ
jgi:hypothetical protein